MSDKVGNPEDRFSGNVAHFKRNMRQKTTTIWMGYKRHDHTRLHCHTIVVPELLLYFFFFKYRNDPKFSDRQFWANSADPDQTAPRGAV